MTKLLNGKVAFIGISMASILLFVSCQSQPQSFASTTAQSTSTTGATTASEDKPVTEAKETTTVTTTIASETEKSGEVDYYKKYDPPITLSQASICPDDTFPEGRSIGNNAYTDWCLDEVGIKWEVSS